MSVLETVAPRRLGPGFRLLLASSWISNLGDGLAVAAGPLLVASLTNRPFLIAAAAFVQWLAPLLFGLWAGALSDRADRKRIVVAVDLVRVALLATLAVVVATGTATVYLVLAALFMLGVAEVFADNTGSTLVPMIVHRDDIGVANARMQAGTATLNQLAGPPIGAALFTAGHAFSFVAQAVLIAAGVVLVARIALPPHTPEHGSPRHDIAEGLRWVRRNSAVRTLVLTIFIFNLTFGAAWSVLVIYARVRLGLGSVGYGLITTVIATGGLVGIVGYGRLTRLASLGAIMRVGLVIETLTHLGLALTTSRWVALPIFFLFGAHAFVWSTTSLTVRQRAVPLRLQGRVTSVNTLGTYAGLVIGAALGGVLADRAGVTAPFWFAFGGSAVFLVLLWTQLASIAHEPAQV